MTNHLPNEVWELIFDQLEIKRDLKSICLVSKRLHGIAVRVLYREITIQVPEEALLVADASILLASRHLSHVRGIVVKAPFASKFSERWDPNDGVREQRARVAQSPPQEINGWPSLIQTPRYHVPRGQRKAPKYQSLHIILTGLLSQVNLALLRKFHWQVGSNSAASTFGKSILRKLLAAPLNDCSFIFDPCRTLNQHLTVPKNVVARIADRPGLRSFSWTGMCWGSDLFNDLRQFFFCEHPELERLELHVLISGMLKEAFGSKLSARIDRLDEQWLCNVFGNEPHNAPGFPSLRELSLQGGSFWPGSYRQFTRVFNLEALRSLNLSHSKNLLSNGLLTPAFASITLEHLQLMWTNCAFVGETYLDESGNKLLYIRSATRRLRQFLRRQQGLRTLHLLLASEDNPWLWKHMEKDVKSVLPKVEQLILHGIVHCQILGATGDTSVPGALGGLNPLLVAPSIKRLGISVLPETFEQGGLKGLDLSNSNLEILHLRFSAQSQYWYPSSIYPAEYLSYVGWGNQRNWVSAGGSGWMRDRQGNVSSEDMANAYSVSTHVERLAHYGLNTKLSGLIEDFVDWAFRDGPPKLKLIACGDFSFDVRYPKLAKMFCRDKASMSSQSGRSWRRVREDDLDLLDLAYVHRDFLGACPLDMLFPMRPGEDAYVHV